jgi:hypothetical protein
MTLEALRAALRHTDERVRAQAARAIGYMGLDAAEAIPDLARMIKQDINAEEAMDALREIGGAAEEALRTIDRLTRG